jgi:hypothetical protein
MGGCNCPVGADDGSTTVMHEEEFQGELKRK